LAAVGIMIVLEDQSLIMTAKRANQSYMH